MEVFLSYYGYRYLSHKTGRWTTRDPLASVPLQFAFHQTNSNKFLGNNLYVLIDNSPTMRIDPYGLCPKCPNGSKVRVSTGWTGCPQEYRTNQQRSSIIETNGCGSKDSAWVPDSFFWIIDFTRACNAHDQCYGTCGSNKTMCDFMLGAEMALECTPLIFFPILHKACLAQAGIYAAAVLGMGGEAYEDAQDENCIWKGCCGRE